MVLHDHVRELWKLLAYKSLLPTVKPTIIQLIHKSKPIDNCKTTKGRAIIVSEIPRNRNLLQSWRVAMISSSLYKRNLQKRRMSRGRKIEKKRINFTLRGIRSNRLRTYSFSPSLTWVPPNSGKRTLSPSLTETGIRFPALSLPPGPTAITFPEFNCNQPNSRDGLRN